MKVEKRTVKKIKKKLVKPARYEERDTGDRRERKTIKENGEVVVDHVPITQRVFFEPVYEDIEVEREVFIVRTIAKSTKGKTLKTQSGLVLPEIEESHEFATEDDALRFISDTVISKRKRGEI